jgi:hypothetical protein
VDFEEGVAAGNPRVDAWAEARGVQRPDVDVGDEEVVVGVERELERGEQARELRERREREVPGECVEDVELRARAGERLERHRGVRELLLAPLAANGGQG